MQDEARKDVLVLVAMLLMIAIPAGLTLASIREPRPPVVIPADPALNPSPYGYTWSLLLFAVPDLVLGWWVLAMHRGRPAKRAFWITVGVLAPIWCLLDVFFGLTFFKFPNLGASVGTFWGYTFDHGWQNAIPIEEIGFYVFGFIAMLLVYIWGDEYLLAAYRKEAPRARAAIPGLLTFHVRSVVIGAALFGLAWLYKAAGPHDVRGGIPGYFLFMLAATIVPSMLCYRIAKPFINWRAMMLAMFYVLFVSIFWEATVGVPYQWWDYNREQMMGVFINAFTGLPLEAVVLWVFAAWAAVIVYETIYTLLHLGWRDARSLLTRQQPAGVTGASP
jgi:hypothetical protein